VWYHYEVSQRVDDDDDMYVCSQQQPRMKILSQLKGNKTEQVRLGSMDVSVSR